MRVPEVSALPPEIAAHPAQPVQPAPLGFRNGVALRTALTVAIMAAMLSWIPFLNVVLWLAAGYFAVFLYRRRTGYLLNVRAGVRIGWITGVLVYAIVALFFGGFLVLLNTAGGWRSFRRSSGTRATRA